MFSSAAQLCLPNINSWDKEIWRLCSRVLLDADRQPVPWDLGFIYSNKLMNICYFTDDSNLLWTPSYLTHSWFIIIQLLFFIPLGCSSTFCSPLRTSAADIRFFLCPDFFSSEPICLTSLYRVYQMPCGGNTDLGKTFLASRVTRSRMWDGLFPRRYALTLGWLWTRNEP